MKKSILFVCTHNSARSQIAEGLVNHYFTNYIAYSAGTEKTKVNPFAISVMNELGIDISHHKSSHIDEFMDQKFDLVITVCDNAKETCPYFPKTRKRIHASFKDPSSVNGSETEIMEEFSKTRDLIKEWLDNNL